MHVVLAGILSILSAQDRPSLGAGFRHWSAEVSATRPAPQPCQTAGFQPAAPPAGRPAPPPPVCQTLPPPPVPMPPPVVQMPPQAAVGWEVGASAGRVAVRGMGVEAVADKLTFAEGRLVLVGHVKVKCAGGQVTGERACIRTADGCVEVGVAPVPVSVPVPPVVQPCTGPSVL